MTLDCCNRMAKELWDSQSMLDEAVSEYEENGSEIFGYVENIPYGNSGKTTKVMYPKQIFYCSDGEIRLNSKNGFGSQYAIPRSQKTDRREDWLADGYTERDLAVMEASGVAWVKKVYPGLYPTKRDLNCIFGIGQDYGKQKILGKKQKCYKYKVLKNFTTGNMDTVKVSALTNEEYKKIGTGAVLRDVEGSRLIYTENSTWREYNARKHIWSDFQETDLISTSSVNASDTAIRKTLADLHYTNETGLFLIGEIIGRGQTVVISNTMNGFTKTDGWRPEFTRRKLCYGNSCLRLSKYYDLLTNQDHANAYIEVIRSSERKGFLYESPEKPIPLKYGVKYYLYLDIESRTPEIKYASDPIEFTIRCFRTERKLLWPSAAAS